MHAKLFIRPTYIWLLLLAITIVSWIGVYGVEGLVSKKTLTVALLGLAFVKARYVLLDFMELRDAPFLIRLIPEIWSVLLFALLAGLYLFG